MLRRILPTIFLLVLAAPPVANAAFERFGVPGASDAPASPKATLRSAKAAVDGRSDVEPTLVLKELALDLPRLGATDRRRARRLLARPTPGETAPSETGYSVPEHNPPFCTAHFCVHWVESTADAPPLDDTNGNGVPNYVEKMGEVFEHVYDVENGDLRWRAPTSDGARGCPGDAAYCMDKTDVYIQEIGDRGIYGYSAPDPGQGRTLHQYAYLVMDNDYSAQEFPKYGGDPVPPMEVTAAHEYNHVLQFGYDVAQDIWMLESTAVWMEDKVYTQVNDYLQYLGPWAQLSLSVPLTEFNSQEDDPLNVKVYGDMVWNRWLDTRFGEDSVRNAWEHSLTTTPTSFAPGAYDQALKARGSTFFDSFTRFAADTAEWRASNTPFAEGSSFPDMDRVRDAQSGSPIVLAPNTGGAGGRLPHLTFGLLEVRPTTVPRLKLVMSAPRGVQSALALVGRTGEETGGRATVALTRLKNGGQGTVTLPDPGSFSRVTAIVINGDGRTTGRFSDTLQDWEWKGDGANMSAHLSTDFTPPRIRRRRPGRGARNVSRRARVTVTFSEAVSNLSTSSVVLVGPGGHKVKARVLRRQGSRIAEIRPRRALARGRRYQVRLSSSIQDRGGNPLPRPSRSWSFRTAR